MITGISHETAAFGIRAPADEAEAFARAVILTICTASVGAAVGQRSFERCMRALSFGGSARMGFRHPTKADAIDRVWRERQALHRAYQASGNKLAFLEELPGIGPVTRRALALRLDLLPREPVSRSRAA